MAGWYTEGRYLCMTGTDLTTADMRALLVKDTYTFDPDHDFVNDVSAAEVTGGSYARQALASESVTRDLAGDRAYFDATDSVFSGVAAGQNNIDAAIVYLYNAVDTAAALFFYCDFTPINGNGSDVTVQWNGSGIAQIA